MILITDTISIILIFSNFILFPNAHLAFQLSYFLLSWKICRHFAFHETIWFDVPHLIDSWILIFKPFLKASVDLIFALFYVLHTGMCSRLHDDGRKYYNCVGETLNWINLWTTATKATEGQMRAQVGTPDVHLSFFPIMLCHYLS